MQTVNAKLRKISIGTTIPLAVVMETMHITLAENISSFDLYLEAV